MKNGKKQIAINTSGGVCYTITTSLRKQGVANVFNLNPQNQHYTAFIVIDETNTDKRMLRQHRIHRDNANERGRSK